MKIISEQLNEKHIEKQIILEQIGVSQNKIKEIEILIDNSKKSVFETILEIISFKLINFTSKYNEIVHKYNIKKTKFINEQKELNNKLQKIINDIKQLEKEFEEKILLFKDELLQFQNYLVELFKQRYINNYTQMELIQKLNNIIQNKEKFLENERIKNSVLKLLDFYNNPTKWIKEANKLFIQNEKINEKYFFDTIEKNPLTDKQQEAVLVNENNNLILAGAGSGKTSVIVAKVSYLLKKNILHPNEILILAFNKNAQEELEERFK